MKAYPVIAALAATLTLSAFAQDTPESRVYVGQYEGEGSIDGSAEVGSGFLSTDVDIDGEFDMILRIFALQATDDPDVYRARGELELDGTIEIEDVAEEDFSESYSFDFDDDFLLDLDDSEFDSDTFRISDVGEFELDIDLDFDDEGGIRRASGDINFELDDDEFDGVEDVSGSGEVTLNRVSADFDTPAGPFSLTAGDVDDPSYRFDFEHNIEEWQFDNIADFTGATGNFDNARETLDVEFDGNEDTFSFIVGPLMDTVESLNRNDLILARYRVQSTVENAAVAPTIRMRSSLEDFSFTTESQFSSVTADSNILPFAEDGRQFVQLVQFPSGSQVFRNYFDLLNFADNDQEQGTIRLDWMELDVEQSFLSSGREEVSYLFGEFNPGEIETHGFVTGDSSDDFSVPDFEAGIAGLTITGVPSDRTQFGFWESGPDNSDVIMEQGRIYRSRYTFATIGAQDRADVPTFRARINDATFQTATIVVVESQDTNFEIPTGAQETLQVDVYHLLQKQMSPSAMRHAFDFILAEQGDNEAGISVILTSIQVESFEAPAGFDLPG